uniref:Beta-secretase 2 n=1 Tax=Bos taurus TaxID=9913 RepID=E1BKV4_BOVIN
VTSVGRGSGARSEEIGDSSFPGKRRRPRRARVNGATLRGPGRTPRLALTLAGAGRGPALVGQPPPARGGSGDQLAELGAGWGGSGASSSRSGRASFSVLLLRSAAAGPAARPALPRSPARRRVAEPLSPDGTGPAQRAPRAPPRAWARWPGRCCCRCWLSGSYERPRRWPPRPSRCLSGWPRPRAEGLCLPRGPDPLLSPARTAWRSPWSPLGVRPTSWPWWITCRGTLAAATTWRCRSGPPRRRSSTYRPKGFDVTVKYTQGSWTGFVGEDVVTIPKGFNSSFLVNIATIFESENFFLPGIRWNGILGLAYATLAKPSSSLETFFDSLVAQAKIPNIFSMQMCGAGLPVAGSGTNGGSLVLGGIEPTLYKGDIWYTPIKEEWYYQIEILKLEIGGQSLNLDCREYNADKAIVDSGTTLLRLPQKVFDAVVEAVARTSLIPEFSEGFWTGSQLACWTNSETPWSYFPKISIYLRDENSSRSFRITILPQLYIQPMMGAGLNYECYRFGISPSTNALVIGATVMEGFYVVFDRAQKRVGFAASPCAEIAGAPVSEISGPFSTEDIASNCVPALPLNEPVLWIVSYTLMSVCGVILLVLITLLLLPVRCRHHPRDPEVVNDESSLVRHRWK